jgi:peptide/nickel transport system permease protein
MAVNLQAGRHQAGAPLRESALSKVLQNRLAYVGAIGCAIIALVALFGPWLVPHDPLAQSMLDRFAPPSGTHWFGTDEFGRDIFSRIIYATRVSVMISLASVLIGMGLGTVIGVIAGYRRGWVDWLAMEFANLFLAFPTIVLGILVLVAIGSGIVNIVIALALAFLPRFIRLARAETLAVAEKAFVEAARAAGASDWRIMFKYILPNVTGTAIITAALWTATAIRAEAALSFLGLGVQPPYPSWGNLISNGLQYILSDPGLIIYPSIAIVFAVLSFNMLGDALRDYFDPRIQDR